MNATVSGRRRQQIGLVTFELSIPLIGFNLPLVPYIFTPRGRHCQISLNQPFEMTLESPRRNHGSFSSRHMRLLFKRGKLDKFKRSVCPSVDLDRSFWKVTKRNSAIKSAKMMAHAIQNVAIYAFLALGIAQGLSDYKKGEIFFLSKEISMAYIFLFTRTYRKVLRHSGYLQRSRI